MTRRALPLWLSVLLSCAADTNPPPISVAARCAEQAGTIDAGKIADLELKEASGLAASIEQADLLWSHNDSGDQARLFALSKTGKARGRLYLDGVTAVDMEDIALARDLTGQSYLYAADIGDNLRARTSVSIYRVREPVLASAAIDTHVTPEVMTFTYPDSVAYDAETILVDPRSSEIYVVTKEKGAGKLFRLGAFASGNSVATEVGLVPVDTATGGNFAPDGKSIVVRDYSGTAKLWPVGEKQSVLDALKEAPCSVNVGLELQGEAICFDTDSKRIFTMSEGISTVLHLTEPAP